MGIAERLAGKAAKVKAEAEQEKAFEVFTALSPENRLGVIGSLMEAYCFSCAAELGPEGGCVSGCEDGDEDGDEDEDEDGDEDEDEEASEDA
jgi:hypothetical protein